VKFPFFDSSKFPNLKQLRFINHFNLPSSLVNHSNLTSLWLNNSKNVNLNNKNLIRLDILNDTKIQINSILSGLTYLKICYDAKINENLKEFCPNLKWIMFDYMKDKSTTFTLPTSITKLDVHFEKTIKITNFDELENLSENERNEIRNKLR
jgi:hypothetical protein